MKDGFEQLLSILPTVNSSGTKPTNAVVLARSAEFIRELKEKIRKDEEKKKELEGHVRRLNDKITFGFMSFSFII